MTEIRLPELCDIRICESGPLSEAVQDEIRRTLDDMTISSEEYTVPIIDFHLHVGRRHQLTPRMIAHFEETIGAETLKLLDDLTPSMLTDYLDREGIERAVLLAEYSPKATGVISSEFISEFCRGTDRLIPFASIDLDSPVDAGTQVERSVRELGCRGLKLLPSYAHFYPDDARILPAYEAARDLGVPVMFHTGSSLFPGTRIKFANPLLLDDVAENFPTLTLILCHGGRPFWYRESEWMLRRHKNVHIDISGLPPKQLPEIFPKLEQFADRFVYGSDWPNIPSLSRQVDMIRQLPYTKETLQMLLWDNGARFLGLESSRLCAD